MSVPDSWVGAATTKLPRNENGSRRRARHKRNRARLTSDVSESSEPDFGPKCELQRARAACWSVGAAVSIIRKRRLAVLAKTGTERSLIRTTSRCQIRSGALRSYHNTRVSTERARLAPCRQRPTLAALGDSSETRKRAPYLTSDCERLTEPADESPHDRFVMHRLLHTPGPS